MSEKIKEALGKLDIDNDAHWTTEGLARLDVMKDLLGGEAVSRADITSAVKGFSRKTPNLEAEEPENTGRGELADAQTTTPEATEDAMPPAVTEDEESEDEQEPEVPLGEYDDAAVEKELEDARANFAKAKERLEEAQAAMDVVIISRQRKEEGRTSAHDIKAYQASQAKQRVEAAQRRQVALATMQAAKPKY